jgi:HSP20 family molecular chaperone IbpA
MTSRVFTFDLGRIMDEAFQFAQGIGESIDRETAEKMRRAAESMGAGPFGTTDYYPTYLYPPATIFLTRDKKMVFDFALAGFDEKDISVQFRGDYLIFSAKAPTTAEPDETIQYFKRRLKMRDIEEQRYYVPADKFDQGSTQATFRNGLLRLVVPPRARTETGEEIRISIRAPGAP